MISLRRLNLNIKSFFIKKKLQCKKNTTIEGKIIIDKYSDIFVVGNAKLNVGSLYMNSYSSITARYDIKIGNDVMIGENVHIYDHNHRFNKKNKKFSSQGYNNKAVSIGNNCWIGSGTVVLAGAKIGDNCVIGANCVIDYEIPDNSIVRSEHREKIEKINFVDDII